MAIKIHSLQAQPFDSPCRDAMMTYQLLQCNLYEYLKLTELEDPFSCGVHTVKEVCLAMGRKMTVS
jgi:hypothetical protein